MQEYKLQTRKIKIGRNNTEELNKCIEHGKKSGICLSRAITDEWQWDWLCRIQGGLGFRGKSEAWSYTETSNLMLAKNKMQYKLENCLREISQTEKKKKKNTAQDSIWELHYVIVFQNKENEEGERSRT